MGPLDQEVRELATVADPLEKALRLAALVSRQFRAAGWELVVVGGSAVEFYTEGAYMSGDIDLCRRSAKPIPLRLAQDLMKDLGAIGGPRSWKVAGLFVDLLGLLENEAKTACRTIETPSGTVTLMPAELAVVERVLVATHPAPDPEARIVAKKLLAACRNGGTPLDWGEVRRLAALPSFGVEAEVDALRAEVNRELGP